LNQCQIHPKRDEILQQESKRTKDLPSVAFETEYGAASHNAQIHINESLTSYRRLLQFTETKLGEKSISNINIMGYNFHHTDSPTKAGYPSVSSGTEDFL